MKKIFTLAAAVLACVSLRAAYPTATTTYTLDSLTITESTLTYEKTGLTGDAQKLNKVLYIDVEVPCELANGNLYLTGTASNTGRFATIWGNHGTERDEVRKVAMKNGNSDPIAFTDDDILEANGKYFIRFSSADNDGSYYDYKIKGFSYVLAEACSSKQIVSKEEKLYNAAVNGAVLTADEVAELEHNQSVTLSAEYVTAPVVTFTKRITIIYDDETQKVSYEDIDVTAEEMGGTWIASVIIGETEYTVKAPKAESYTVTYMHGEKVLGTEAVAKNSHPADYAQYEVLPLATFGGWYREAALENRVEPGLEMIVSDETYYAKFEKTYLSASLNIEQIVLDYGKGYDIRSALTAAGWAYENLNDLDSLNDEKSKRNEPYLGLKLKTAGAYVAGWLKADEVLNVKFGNVADNVLINGVEISKDDLAEPYQVTVIEDTYVKIETTSKNTVVLKQLMLNEPIAPVTLPDSPQGLNPAKAAVKAVKVIRDGQLLIEQNGQLYNAQGTIVN